MIIKKIVQEELGEELYKHGFHCAKGEPFFWTYEREKKGIHQEIIVAQDRFEKGYLKVIFSSDAYGQRPKEFRDFVPEEGAKHWDYWKYNNEEELRKVLQEFKRLIQAYGYDFLEKIGKPATDAIPTKEANRYLYLHHHELWKEYEVKMNTEKKEVEQVIDMIYQKLDELLDEPFKQVEDILLGLAALYGHTIDKMLKRKYEVIKIYYYRSHPEEIERGKYYEY